MQEKAQEDWRIFYSSNRQGEIAPCGCQTNQLGGLNRMTAVYEKAPETPPAKLFFDAGDTFFSNLVINPSRKRSETLASEVIARVYKMIGVNALSPGERDFAMGIEKLKELEKMAGVTLVASNLVDSQGKAIFPRTQVFTGPKGSKVGVFALASEEAFANVPGVKVQPVDDIFEQAIKDLRSERVNRVVLLSHLGLNRDREIAARGGVDLIIGSHSLDAITAPVLVGKTWIVQPLNQGQQLGWVDMLADGSRKHNIVDLDKSVETENPAYTLMEAHKNDLRGIAIAGSNEPVLATSKKPYVAHAQQCRTCHQKQHDFWRDTKHSSAYLVLYAKNQHFDPECITCHSVGFQQPGGFNAIAKPLKLTDPKLEKKGKPFIEEIMKAVFIDDKQTPLDSRTHPERYAALKKRYHEKMKSLEDDGMIQKLYIGVQCENCHGNRNGHPSSDVKTQKKVSVESCKQCHSPPNANPFDPATFPKVACPLSGT